MQHTSITLRPIELTDFPQVLLWSQDVQFCKANGWIPNQDENRLFKWWSTCVENTSSDLFRIGIEWNQRLIGYVDFAEIKDGCAEIGIAIGDSTLWQKGLGKEALARAIKFGATNYSIRTYTAETDVSNVRAQKLIIRAGFKEVKQVGSTISFELNI
ncbi:GNAT family N-acetyltransferase [Chryseomicrobium sp. FSL W7-1435]|uniref:GNAT family N-acetyltransferase n=1 Tax=Chryseomicrobium sp. FSL W7-1435 TaxID=2921704 RepID=UPI003159BF3C